MTVRIVDVAKLAGVSPGTVSKVLNNKGYVSEYTREKVLKAVSELGYKHKASKKNFTQAHRKVCILFNVINDSILGNPMYGEIMQGVEECLSQYKYQIIFKSLSGDYKKDVNIIYELTEDPMLNGILYTGYNPDDHELVIYLKNLDIPIVFIDNDKWDYDLNCIVNDDLKGSFEMVSKLIEYGHREIAFIGGPLTHISLKKRHDGYVKALEKAGIKLKKSLIEIIHSDRFSNEGAEAVQHLLKNNKPTAIFAANDELAIGAMNQLIKMGYKIPDDISIAGFDGIDMGLHVIPALSSVYINKKEMGKAAAMRLYQLMNNMMTTPVKIIMSIKVIIKDSVKKINEEN